jgi:hypothetical protein
MDREFNLDITLCYHSVKLMPRIVKLWEGHACRMTVVSILQPLVKSKPPALSCPFRPLEYCNNALLSGAK